MNELAEQEVIEIGDFDAEAFNEFAAEQGWSDGMPLYIPTEEKVAKFVDTVRGDNRLFAPVPPRHLVLICEHQASPFWLARTAFSRRSLLPLTLI